MNNKHKERIKKLLWLLRIPESMLAFAGGAFISYSINIFTSSDASVLQYVAAGLFCVASLLLALWALAVKPVDEFYNKTCDGADKLTAWYDALNEKKSSKRAVCAIAILSIIAIIAGFSVLIVSSCIQVL